MTALRRALSRLTEPNALTPKTTLNPGNLTDADILDAAHRAVQREIEKEQARAVRDQEAAFATYGVSA